jgi:hypothetical protein
LDVVIVVCALLFSHNKLFEVGYMSGSGNSVLFSYDPEDYRVFFQDYDERPFSLLERM